MIRKLPGAGRGLIIAYRVTLIVQRTALLVSTDDKRYAISHKPYLYLRFGVLSCQS